MTKKILILEDSSQSTYGGGQKISKIVIESIADNHELFLSDYGHGGLFFNDVKQYLSGFILLSLKKSSNAYTQRLFQSFFFIKNLYCLIRFIKQNNIELVYATTKLTLVVAYTLKKILKTPFLYHSHMAPNSSKSSGMLVRLMKNADATIAVSNYVKDQILINDNAVNVAVLYNPIEYGLGKPKNIRSKVSLNAAFFGSIKYEKGVETLLEVARESKLPFNVTFNLYGAGNILDEIKVIAPHNVVFKGHIDDVENELIKNVDVLILPSIIPEACPTIILQAMTKGLPVITTNIGGQNELIRNDINGYIVPIKSAAAISAALLKLFKDNETYEKISKNNLRDILQKPDRAEYKKSILEIIG